MTLRNILVHLDESERSAVRLNLAIALAGRDGARLLGLFAQLAQPHQVGVVAHWPSESYRLAAETSRACFEAAAKGLAQAEWRDANRGSAGEITEKLVEAARHVDLAILGQHAPDGDAPLPADLAEQVVLNAGRPVLVVPYVGAPDSLGERVIVAWNGSREAARALNDALPLLPPEAQLLVMSVHNDLDATDDLTPDVVRQLCLHGFDPKVEGVQAGGIGLMDQLLNRLADISGDLLVMGAYGHYGFPQLARGSGTRYILGHMTAPVLFSH